MTDLSPAAQAVLDAASNHWPGGSNHPSKRACVAAALRAAVNQCEIPWQYHPDYPETELVVVASDLLAIADELEGQGDG